MKRYDTYKPSGVEWIGEIPEHWSLKKIFHGFKKIGSGTTPAAGNLDYYEENGFNWLQTGDLKDNEINYTSKKISQKALEDYPILRFFGPGSLVIAMYGATIGKTGILNIETTTNQACCVLSQPTTFISKYVFYWFNANKSNIISLSYGGGQPNISQEIVKSLRLPCPSMQEQTAIANYLDQKTAEIDHIISKKQQLIELLKEERTAVINDAVSGEGKNWKKKKLKYVAKRIQTGSTPPSNESKYYYEELNWFTPSDFSEKLLLKNSRRKIAQLAVSDGMVKMFPSNSVLFIGIGATLGKVGYILEPATSNQQINCLSFRTKHQAVFYANWFFANQENIVALANAATLPILNQAQMKDILVPVPNFKDEYKITIDYIQKETQRIDNTITKIEKEITLLQEYRTALISEVVTGKIKVA